MRREELQPNEYGDYFGRYVNKIAPDKDLLPALQEGKEEVTSFIKKLNPDKYLYRYAADKWSIQEVLQHVVDTERIFAYRLLRIARGDKKPLQGFEQDDYIKPARADEKSMHQILDEFTTTRNQTISLVTSLTPDDLRSDGVASGVPLSARAIGYIIAGHEIWHLEILKERYLS